MTALTLKCQNDIIIRTEKPNKLFHRNVRKLGIEGEFIEDSQIPLVRAQYEKLLIQDARSRGYLPVLDLDTAWSTWYDATRNRWYFRLTVYVVYMGKRKAKEWEGISSGKLIPRNIQKVM